MNVARDRLYQMIGGYRVSQLMRTAAELRLCDTLADGPLDFSELAARAGADPVLLRRLCRALCAYGVLAEQDDGRFANAELGEFLRSDVEGSLRPTALGMAMEPWWQAWARLPAGIRGGEVPFELAHDQTFWQLVAADPDVKDRFNGMMVGQTSVFASQLVEAFDFAACSRIVDVGGGNGALAAGILKANPTLHATVFDLEAGLDGAEGLLQREGVRDRCDLVAGSFFEAVPAGADAYLLRLILHDWDDDLAAAILATCRRAMRPGAWLLVIDVNLPDRVRDEADHRHPLLMDMHMYVLFGARERSTDELRHMLEAAGFALDRVASTVPTAVLIARAV